MCIRDRAWIERFAAETSGAEPVAETIEDVGADWLRSVERKSPAPQIQIRGLARGDLPRTQRVTEARPSTRGHPVVRDRLQPPQRLLHEVRGRHQDARSTQEQWLQYDSDPVSYTHLTLPTSDL